MQSKKEDPNRPKNLTVAKAAKYIYQQNGLKGLYRGVTPRIGLGVWQTVCMVGMGDMYASLQNLTLYIWSSTNITRDNSAKEAVAKLTGEVPTGKH